MRSLPIHVRAQALLLACAAALAACDGGSSGPGGPLSLSTADTTLEVGQTVQLSARGFSATPAWSSSDNGVVTVLSTGYVTAAGPGTAQVTAISGGRTASATVTVLRPPTVAVSPAAAGFSAYVGGGDAPAQGIAVTNMGGVPLTGMVASVTYPAGKPADWLSFGLSPASAPATLVLQPQTGTLPAGTYTATVRLSSSQPRAQGAEVAVAFSVAPAPVVSVAPASAGFVATLGGADPAEQALEVSNAVASPLTDLVVTPGYGANQPTGWLAATLGGGSAPATLRLRARTAGLPVGVYTASVDVGSTRPGIEARRVPVVFTISPPPAVALSSPTLAFGAVPGGTDPEPRTLAVTNGGGGTLGGLSVATAYTAGQPSGWLTAVLAGTSAPGALTLRARTAGLAEGEYGARVTVSSSTPGVEPAVLLVSFSLRRTPVVQVEPSMVAFTATALGTDPAAVRVDVRNGGGGALTGLSVSTSYGPGATGWLDPVSLAGTAAPTAFTLQARTGSLSAGTYTADVSVGSSLPGVPAATVAVRFTVDPTPVIRLSAGSHTFRATVGGGDPPPQAISVTEAGGRPLTGLTATVEPAVARGWLSATISPVSAPAVLTLTATTPPAEHSYTAEVVIRSATQGVDAQRVTVRFEVGPAPVVALSASTVAFPAAAAPHETVVVNVRDGSATPATGLDHSVVYEGTQTGWLMVGLDRRQTPALLTLRVAAGSLPRSVDPYRSKVIVTGGSGARPDTVVVEYAITVSFASDVAARFNGRCTGCHSNSTLNLGNAATAYVDLLSRRTNRGFRRVTPFLVSTDSADNHLLCTLAAGQGCRDMRGYIFGADSANVMFSVISRWLLEGAPDN